MPDPDPGGMAWEDAFNWLAAHGVPRTDVVTLINRAWRHHLPSRHPGRPANPFPVGPFNVRFGNGNGRIYIYPAPQPEAAPPVRHVPVVIYFDELHVGIPAEVCEGCSDGPAGRWVPASFCPQAAAVIAAEAEAADPNRHGGYLGGGQSR